LAQPTRDESFSILDLALSKGIDTFDTAWAYGEAEDVLGEWIENKSLRGKVKIISKMKPHSLNDYPDGTKSSEIIEKEISKSLNRLKLDYLDGYLFHSPYYVYMSHVLESLKKAKDKGLVRNIGVSIYDESEALQAINSGIDYIQIPYNVFDQRLDTTDFFEIVKKNKVKVFARSPFLQGVLLMKPDELPSNLSYLKPYLEKFISISLKYNLSQKEAALAFVCSIPNIDYIVFGVETVEQLSQNIDIVKNLKVNDDFIKEIRDSFKDLNKGAINPSLWTKLKK